MSKTYIRNAQIFFEHSFVEKTICIHDGKILLSDAECDCSDGAVLDATGLKAVPGFIDIHTHGAAGVDVNNADICGFEKISEFFVQHGVTSWQASVITDTEEKTEDVLHTCMKYIRRSDAEGCNGIKASSELIGVHLEGPFLATDYKGAMPEHLLKKPDTELLKKYQDVSEDIITYITVSPELDGAEELIKEAETLGITVSIGHSGATYDKAMAAIEAGAKVGTHVGNAMRLIHQHEPAIFGALIESDCYCEVICDGRHLHPGMVRMLSKAKGMHRLIAISDSIMAAGLPDGNYRLGVNDVVVEDGDAKLASDGTRAGSTLTLDMALRNIIEFTGVRLEEAIPVLTENPAKAVNVYDRKGSIENGKDADIVLLDDKYNVCHVFARGVQIK